ncbi:MAG: recombination protein O N-terminal domain-containing protein [Acidobacteria bacterium]|nr:recombination protein O N-terminal domain-containing protein [Acidobacteriota bacterium]
MLRTFPLKEADLIVSFFTRDHGKLRGVANRARKPKGGFGSSLERLSQVQIHYTARENRDLVRIDHCDLQHSQFELSRVYSTGVALDVMAEISEHLLPLAEVNEKYFRLMARVLEFMRLRGESGVWQAVTYFEVWAVRLSGFLPEVPLSAESTGILSEILKSSVEQMPEREWTQQTARDLRRAMVRLIESHIERRLLAAPMLEDLA